MKILIPRGKWEGGTIDFFGRAFENLGHEVKYCHKIREKNISKITYYLKLRQIKKFETYIQNKLDKKYNENIISTAISFKPDILFSLNARFFPETIKFIKTLSVKTVSLVHDYPFDSTRFKYFPYTLQYFDSLFLAEMLWKQNIKNIAPQAEIYHMVGAYSPEKFHPVQLDRKEIKKYQCNVGFAGASYGNKAEGAYRAGILSQISDYGLKIWGDKGWKNYIAKYYPNISNCYAGSRLNFDELNKLYQITEININLPNPQCLSTFQQRIFEVAAAKGFQIVDHRTDIYKYFNEDEIVTFKNIQELKNKIEFFLNNPDARKPYIDKAYKKVKYNHTYENRIKTIIEKINI